MKSHRCISVNGLVKMIQVRPPTEMSDEEIATIVEIVRNGGESFPSSREELLQKASLVMIYGEAKGIVGVAALKRPTPEYRQRLFSKMRSSHDPDGFEHELGWVHVTESHRGRGIARSMVTELLGRIGGGRVFSVIRAENDAMRSLLKGMGFHKSGVDLPTARADGHFSLYVKE